MEVNPIDPNAALAKIRELVVQIVERPSTISSRDTEHPENNYSLVTVATELAEGVDALDTWLTCGGFLPNAWSGTGA